LETPAIVARHPGSTRPEPAPGGRLRPGTFLSFPFLFPFAVVAGGALLLSTRLPERDEARLVLSMPREDPVPVERVAPDLAAADPSLGPIRLFFRSPDRMLAALQADGDAGRDRTASAEIRRHARRLASQVSVKTAPSPDPRRTNVEVTLWTDPGRDPTSILSSLAADFFARSRRLETAQPKRIAKLREEHAAAEGELEARRAELFAWLDERLPEGVALSPDALLAGDGGFDRLREALREARASDPDGGIEDLGDARRRLRELRLDVGVAERLREETGRQIEALERRMATVAPDTVRRVSGPAATPPPDRRPWVALVSIALGAAAGSLSLLVRLLFVGPQRARRRF